MQEIDLPAAQPISGRRRMVTAAVLILLVGPALAFAGFQLLAPASTRAGLIFLLGFEPWRLTSITPLASGGFLIEEQFNPQRGTWTRLTVVDDAFRETASQVYSEEVRVRAASSESAWVERGNVILELGLSDLSTGQSLVDWSSRSISQPVASARFDETTVIILATDGREHQRELPHGSRPAFASEARVLTGSAPGRPVSLTMEGERGVVTWDGGRTDLLAPKFLRIPGGPPLTLGQRVLVSHKHMLGPSRALVSVVPDIGWSPLDLREVCEAGSDANVTPVWSHQASGGPVLAVDVRDGRRSTTVFVQLTDEGARRLLMMAQ